MVGTPAAGRHMAEHGGGSIVNTTSMGAADRWIAARSSTGPRRRRSSSSAGRRRSDLAEYGIRVNCVAPGHIGHRDHRLRPRHRSSGLSQPLQRQGTPAGRGQRRALPGQRPIGADHRHVMPVDGGTAAGPPIHQTNAPRSARNQEVEMPADLVIRGGTVVDGTGGPARVADVAVDDGVIVDDRTGPARHRRSSTPPAASSPPGSSTSTPTTTRRSSGIRRSALRRSTG